MKIQSHTYFIWCVFWRAEASMGEHTFSQRGRSSHWTTWNKKPEMVPRKATEVGNEIPNLFHCTAFFSVLNFLTSFIFVGYETLHAYVRCCWNHSFSAFLTRAAFLRTLRIFLKKMFSVILEPQSIWRIFFTFRTPIDLTDFFSHLEPQSIWRIF